MSRIPTVPVSQLSDKQYELNNAYKSLALMTLQRDAWMYRYGCAVSEHSAQERKLIEDQIPIPHSLPD